MMQSPSHFVCFLCLVGHLAFTSAMFTVEEAAVKIIFPPGNKIRIDMALADFGKPRYGGSLIGQLVYPTSEEGYLPQKLKCTPYDCQYGCTPFNESSPPFSIKKEPRKTYIMLIDRGSRGGVETSIPCYYLTKVINAQLAGADAVILANDVAGSLSTAIPPDDEAVLSLMDSLKISAGLISKEDANTLKALMKQRPVTLALNWTNILPRQTKVTWEFWTNSNDECGTNCRDQVVFIKTIKDTAKQLMQKDLATFTPHYMQWSCPEEYVDLPECVSQCILNGTYCAPDPDGDPEAGYTGVDVLQMNLAEMCFYQVASNASQPWLWWDYVSLFGDMCKMVDKNFNLTCARQVFALAGATTMMVDESSRTRYTSSWETCLNLTPYKVGDKIAAFEQELVAQAGVEGEEAVTILPTIRINTHQYRGQLDAGTVVRALCSAFPAGQEPGLLCNQEWVSGEDECIEGGEGWKLCHSGDPLAQGRTQCTNTFSGYSCDCQNGWLRSTNPDTGEDMCTRINECISTTVSTTLPDCACERCACVYTSANSSFQCSGALDNQCTADRNYGGCWHESIGGREYNACVDEIAAYKAAAAQGSAKDKWYSCYCPPCFGPTFGGGCERLCDLQYCDLTVGACLVPVPGGNDSAPRKGASTSTIIVVVLLSVLASAGVMYGVYQLVLKQRMHAEVRDIMSQYMPLENMEMSHASAGGPGGGGRSSVRSEPEPFPVSVPLH